MVEEWLKKDVNTVGTWLRANDTPKEINEAWCRILDALIP